MGYSNNKWRKILIILMIVNLCFILFSKITRVLGYYSSSPTSVVLYNNIYDLDLHYITDNYDYYFLMWNNLYQNNRYTTNITLYCANSEISIDTTNYSLTIASGQKISVFNATYKGSDSTYPYTNVVNAWNSTQFNPTLTSYHSYTNTTTTVIIQNYGTGFGYNPNNNHITLSNYDVKDNNNNIIHEDNTYIPPNFDNITEIENGYPDGVFVSRGSYSEDDYLYFHLLKITNTVPDGNQSNYYYESKIFKLRKDTKYYRTYPADIEHEHSYYYITRSQLTLDTNSSYLYVLSNSSDKIDSSYGILQPDIPGGIYDVIASDTAGVITEQEALNDKMANINETQQEIANSQQEVANNSNNINNFLNENTVSNESNNNIDTSLNFNNNAPQFSSLFNGYFSRLTSIISDLGNYQDTDVITISIPIPFTNDTIPIRSNFIFANQNNTFLKNLATTLWYFIFGRYFLIIIPPFVS